MKTQSKRKRNVKRSKNPVSNANLYERFRQVSQKLRVVAYLFRSDGPGDFLEEDFEHLEEGIGLILGDLSDEILNAAEEVYLLA